MRLSKFSDPIVRQVVRVASGKASPPALRSPDEWPPTLWALPSELTPFRDVARDLARVVEQTQRVIVAGHLYRLGTISHRQLDFPTNDFSQGDWTRGESSAVFVNGRPLIATVEGVETFARHGAQVLKAFLFDAHRSFDPTLVQKAVLAEQALAALHAPLPESTKRVGMHPRVAELGRPGAQKGNYELLTPSRYQTVRSAFATAFPSEQLESIWTANQASEWYEQIVERALVTLTSEMRTRRPLGFAHGPTGISGVVDVDTGTFELRATRHLGRADVETRVLANAERLLQDVGREGLTVTATDYGRSSADGHGRSLAE